MLVTPEHRPDSIAQQPYSGFLWVFPGGATTTAAVIVMRLHGWTLGVLFFYNGPVGTSASTSALYSGAVYSAASFDDELRDSDLVGQSVHLGQQRVGEQTGA